MSFACLMFSRLWTLRLRREVPVETTKIDLLHEKSPAWPHPEDMTRHERMEYRLEQRKMKRNERESKRYLLRLLSYFACGMIGAVLGASSMALSSSIDFRILLFVFPVTAALAGILTAYLLSVWWMSSEEEPPAKKSS